MALEIVEMLIAQEFRKGTPFEDPVVKDLSDMKNEILRNNVEVINFVINNYKQALNIGENNGN